jgi:hypothetical protein
MRCVAVDWSGRASDAREYIWIAEAVGGELTFLESGRRPGQVVEWLLTRERPLVVGFDFAFSFPRWFCDENGWASGPDVWAAIAADGEAILDQERPPFWGRTSRRPDEVAGPKGLRTHETVLGTKSVFQIGGAGAVGTGSIRGMPWLLALSQAGWAIWPFDAPGPATALEIYPRALYGPGRVVKSRWTSRREALGRWFPDHPAPLIERAAGSEDAFDAAVAALRMSQHEAELAALPVLDDQLEGAIWAPATAR